MEITNQELQRIIKHLKKNTSDLVEISTYIFFEEEGISSHSVHCQAIYSKNTNIEGCFKASPTKLLSFLSSFSSDDYVSITTDETTLNITIHGSTITFADAKISTNDLPFIKLSTLKEAGTLQPKEVQHLYAAINCSIKDPVRPAMEAIALREDKIIATDTNKVFQIKDTNLKADQDLIIKPSIIKLLDKKQPCTIFYDEKAHGLIKQNGLTLRFLLIDEPFPVIDNVYPETKDLINTAIFSKKELLKELKKIESSSRDVRISFTTEKVIFESFFNEEQMEDEEDLTTIKVSSKYQSLQPFEHQTGFRIKNLKELLNSIDNDLIKFQFTKKTNYPIIVNKHHLIMPIIITPVGAL